MPYANNHGVRIHYEVEGAGPALVLQHGLGSGLDIWKERSYVDALRGEYLIILIDSRGHGHSDKPHEPTAYAGEPRAADVAVVLDELGVKTAHYWGYSSGGQIGFAVAKHAPERFHSLVLGAPFHYPSREEVVQVRSEIRRSLEGGVETRLARAQEHLGGQPMPPENRARILASDTQALLAVMSGEDSYTVDEVVRFLALPFLIYAGEADPFYLGAKECAE